MKTLIFTLLLLTTLIAKGQISTQNYENGSMTITPKGLQGSTNSTPASNNIALGIYVLYQNTTGTSNTAIGNYSLYANKEGYSNTATGFGALGNNTSGNSNTADGHNALNDNTIGNLNVAIGSSSLTKNTTGSYNIGMGYFSGFTNRTGSNNTYLGYNADATAVNFSNATALGAEASVNASNKIRLGNGSITSIEGQVAYSYPSDRRLKENIQYTSQLGLNFINRLQTVSYNYISDKTHVRHDGFIAQDVEQVMTELGVPFSGLKKSDDGTYSLAYSDFVMPLVNAVKEQQKEIEELKKQVQALIKAVNKP